MKLRAEVRERTAGTRHTVAGVDRSAQIESVVIEPTGGAFYLLYFDSASVGIADTWHLTIEDAKDQAAFESNIGDADWKQVDE